MTYKTDGGQWAWSIVDDNRAIVAERGGYASESEAEADADAELAERLQFADAGFDLSRIRAALDGRFNADMLSPDEMEIYEDLLGETLATPDAAELAFFANMRKQGGAVGYDEAGRYVRSLPGGDVEIIKEADSSDQ